MCVKLLRILLEHPPCSPHLAPSDFYLFPKLKTLPRWSAFFFESRGDCSCRGVFCRSYEEPLQGRDNAGINVLVLGEIMLKNKNNFEITHSFFSFLGRETFRAPSYAMLNPLTLRRLMSYIYGAPILDVSRSHTTTQHSR